MEQVYDVFAPYAAGDLCRQCFSAEEAADVLTADRRTAPYDAFRAIHQFSAECAGGPATFKHWLGRTLEVAFIDYNSFGKEDLVGRLARMGVLSWPEEEQRVLRQLFSRAAINWIGAGELAPLGYQPGRSPNFISSPHCSRDIWSGAIAAVLALLRVDMSDFYAWLLDPASANRELAIWSCVGDCSDQQPFEGLLNEGAYSSFLSLPAKIAPEDYVFALDALAARSRNQLSTACNAGEVMELALQLSEAQLELRVLIEGCADLLSGNAIDSGPNWVEAEATIARIVSHGQA